MGKDAPLKVAKCRSAPAGVLRPNLSQLSKRKSVRSRVFALSTATPAYEASGASRLNRRCVPEVMVNQGCKSAPRLPLSLRLWGWMTTLRVMHEELGASCCHDGTGRLCVACAFVVEDGVWSVADFAP